MKLSLNALFQPTVMFAMALMAVIVMMILPMPSVVLDIGLAASFALAILIFTVTLFIERPLDFSAFPTILLASLMLRLSLNVSSTKLIIGQGHTGTSAAGGVIEGFAMFVMGGSVLMGLVVFCVLLIVNFIVINKGATRMAEVGARFALDAMPGKQLAIDSDMSAGAIDHAEARRRRETEQAETTFFGSLDGASKFVKGDAVAGLLITALNLVMGLIMGVGLHGMPVGQAFETYSILTVGDGLVSQIPSVIISIASALLLARGGATGAADVAIMDQLGRYPSALITVSLLMALFGLVPGLPFAPFFAGALILGGTGVLLIRRRNKQPSTATVETSKTPEAKPTLGDALDLDDIHVEFAPDLIAMVLDPATGLDARIVNMRQHIATEFGVILPEIRLTDNPALKSGGYVIKLHGVEKVRDILRPDRILALLSGPDTIAIAGEDVKEPVYGAPARWIAKKDQETAALDGITTVLPTEVLATHLLETIKQNFPRLMTMRALRRLLDELVNLTDPMRKESNRKFLDELVPEKVPLDLLLAVVRLLLDERISIRNLPLIIEVIAEVRSPQLTAEMVAEHVRQRLNFQIIAPITRADGTIPLIQLAPEWEETFATYQSPSDKSGQEVALPPELFNKLADSIAEKVSKQAQNGTDVAIVTSTRRRRFIRTITRAKGISAQVISFEEIGFDARPSLVGVVPA